MRAITTSMVVLATVGMVLGLPVMRALAEPAPLKADRPVPRRAPAPVAPADSAAGRGAPASPNNIAQAPRGRVLETMDAGGYTYARVETAGSEQSKPGQQWIAGPSTSITVGNVVAWPPGSDEMRNFESKTLGRTFDSILFVPRIVVFGSDEKAASASPHADLASRGEPQEPIPAVAKAEDGWTVAELYDQRSELDGKPVIVRARVVKFNGAVMKRNWLHLRDGSRTSTGDNDLTVTSQDRASVGDTVLVRGTLVVNKDFGFGYRYDVLVEQAQVEVERTPSSSR